uniref:Uncharacterized protein n=1 Tax=Stomoxys calcitrans TaxID=35570 RepID=A0A1I8Q8T5_STOCA
MSSQKASVKMASRKKYPAPLPPVNHTLNKGENILDAAAKSQTKKLALRKVKKIVSKINQKISQFMDAANDVKRYQTLVDDFSPLTRSKVKIGQPLNIVGPNIRGNQEEKFEKHTTTKSMGIVAKDENLVNFVLDPYAEYPCYGGQEIFNFPKQSLDPKKDIKDKSNGLYEGRVKEVIKNFETMEIVQKLEQPTTASKLTSHRPCSTAAEVKNSPKPIVGEMATFAVTKPIPPPRRKKRFGVVFKEPLTQPQIIPITLKTKTCDIEEDSESGFSSLPKTTSDESQPESKQSPSKPMKPLRKKKMRCRPSWIKENSLVIRNSLCATDSESDGQKLQKTPKKGLKGNSPCLTPSSFLPHKETELSQEDWDQSLMRVVNSPNKVKSAYTLTVVTPFPLKNASFKHKREEFQTGVTKDILGEMHESYDHGFNTESETSPCKSNLESPKRNELQQASKGLNLPSNFSTPIKSLRQRNLNSAFKECGESPQKPFSPISSHTPLNNNGRISFYGNDSRHNSLAMQVIHEDHSLENKQNPPQTPGGNGVSNTPFIDGSAHSFRSTSSFWIQSGDFSIALEIFKTEAERLRLLYEIFSQRSCEVKDVHFGIDDQKFSVHHKPVDGSVPRFKSSGQKETSHYWFSTGDMTIPFNGKYLPKEKIQRIFHFLKSSVEETGVLRFGVDAMEFSNVSEFWMQSPKFSLESNYSMLVGLHSVTGNGLGEFCKNFWPHSESEMRQNQTNCEELSTLPGKSFSHYDCNLENNEEISIGNDSLAVVSDRSKWSPNETSTAGAAAPGYTSQRWLLTKTPDSNLEYKAVPILFA